MRKAAVITILVVGLGAGTALAQGVYTIDTVHSNVNFKIRHLISKVGGEFNDFSGSITADFRNLDRSSVEFVIDATSIDTKNEDRDTHLRSEDFFDVKRFPVITFKSTKITRVDDDTFAVTGNLTMHGVTRGVTLTVDHLGEMAAMGGIRAGYELSTVLNRKDFDIIWNKTLDNGGLVLGDDVEVEIHLEVVKQEDEAEAS